MQRQLGVALAHARGEAEVGDDERVEAGEIRRFQRRQRRLDFVVLEQRVERQIRAGVVQMGGLDRLDGRLAGEVAGEGARAPAFETEVDGVGAGGQGRAQARAAPRPAPAARRVPSGHALVAAAPTGRASCESRSSAPGAAALRAPAARPAPP